MKLPRWPSKPKPRAQPEFVAAPVSPDAEFVAIGDVHGRHDLLLKMLDRVAEKYGDVPLVFVGDLVDRGDHSADVLSVISERAVEAPTRFITLLGNHEEMLLHFLDDPDQFGRRWMRYGGLQTLASFGVGGVHEGSSGAPLIAARDALREKLGEATERWLRGLPRKWQSGNVAVVHAGADPHLPMQAQLAESLTWGHADFTTIPRRDGTWVVHGHTIVAMPCVVQGRVAIDTGAYATGRLTGAFVGPDVIDFLQV